MFRTGPLTCFGVASIFFGYAAIQYFNVSIRLPDWKMPAFAVSPVRDRSDSTQPTPGGKHPPASVTDSVTQFLSDVDDLLDTVHDRASFEAIKPKLVSRVREQAALATSLSNKGMSQVGALDALAMQKAALRHMQALLRAEKAAPGVMAYFGNDLANALQGQRIPGL